jgi:hypothetical protein
MLHFAFQSVHSFLQTEQILTSRIIHPCKGLFPKSPSRQQPLQHCELLFLSAKPLLLRSLYHPQFGYAAGAR